MDPNPDDGTAGGFGDLPLRRELLDAVASLGYEQPTPIQRDAIPPLVEGRDLLGQAATGTGKTAAFALPVLQRLDTDRSDADRRGAAPLALILVPTRELAVQVAQATDGYGRTVGARVLPVYGGTPIGRQLRSLERGVDVVVATPGRALDHLSRGTLPLDELQMVVLDEADEMLDMGFAEDIEAILEQTPPDTQTVLFSATMPPRIETITHRHLSDPVRILLEREERPAGEEPQVRHAAYAIPRGYKAAALGRLLEIEEPSAAIVFCRTREEVDRLTEDMNGRGLRAEALHGGMGQEQRDRVMARLRGGTAELLVATDVAARGLDVDQLTHVVNYSVPTVPESYVHRVGRVGRAGREGVAITLMEPREHRLLKAIRRSTGMAVPVEDLPSAAVLRERRLHKTRSALEGALADGAGLEAFRSMVESLAEEHGAAEVAMAAARIAHVASGRAADDERIPEVSLKPEPDKRARRDTVQRRGENGGRGEYGGRRAPGSSPERTRLFVGAGRSAKIRPQDLVGAIAGESGLSGRDIGAIEIADRFSLVEVPTAHADDVIKALQGSTIKGRRAVVRRDSGRPGGGKRERR